MQVWHAALIAVFFGCGTYLIQQNSFVKVVFGFGLLSHAANMLILLMAGPAEGLLAPIVPGSPGQPSSADMGAFVDPLPQALILTAIVIGFALTAYLCVLLYRLFLDYNTTRVDQVYTEEARESREEAQRRQGAWDR
jgi:multicomponent Na+:H+ antiporter subunit C